MLYAYYHESGNPLDTDWRAADARQTNLGTITFTNKNGTVTSNAQVFAKIDRQLLYKLPRVVGGGAVELKSLPPEIQSRFGYDPAKAAEKGAREATVRKAKQDAELERTLARENLLFLVRPDVEVLEAKTKLIDDVADYSRLAYTVTIANRKSAFVLNDVLVNLLDAEGFI